MANINEIANAFVQHYYNTFDNSRANLITLYQENSMLTFEGSQLQGPQNILGKLSSLPLTIKHKVTTIDVQPTGAGALVFVSGQMVLDANENPLNFSQVFHLLPIPNNPGGFFVLNDIFRLNNG